MGTVPSHLPPCAGGHYFRFELTPKEDVALEQHNLLGAGSDERIARMMEMLVAHLELFVRGKMEVEGLGDFCCASRPLRDKEETIDG
jgi:hypothetical protein